MTDGIAKLYGPWLLCEPNEKEGKKLLEEIMKGGNFGQYDTRDAALKRGGVVKQDRLRIACKAV